MTVGINESLPDTGIKTSPTVSEDESRIELLKDSYEQTIGKITDEQKELEDKVRKELDESWPKIVKDLLSHPDLVDMPQSRAWLETVMEANVPHGKKNRSIAAALLYAELVPERNKEQEADAYILGWSIEILQAASLMADDMMDGSETRRGRPCWYREPHVGLTAVKDAFLLEHVVYEVLNMSFRDKPCYADIVRLLQRTSYKTILGQSLDTRLGIEKNIDAFNMKLYWTMVKYKTSYYTYYAPAAATLMMAGIKDPEAYTKLEEIMLEMGHYFQIQDDYIDCYGDPAVTGKIGTDIIDGKCSWLFIRAMELATEEEKLELKKCYGVHDSDKEKRVKELYDQIGITDAFDQFEENIYVKINKLIEGLPACIPKKPIRQGITAIYKRVR